MKASIIKQIIKEEILRNRKRLLAEQENPAKPEQEFAGKDQVVDEPNNSAPAFNTKKSQGIIAGAIKTLINSGALQGIDPTQVDKITNDLMSSLQNKIDDYKAITTPEDEEDDTELEDEVPYKQQDDDLDDQTQYDPDLDKQIKDKDEEPSNDSPPEDEPLFEASHFKKFFK